MLRGRIIDRVGYLPGSVRPFSARADDLDCTSTPPGNAFVLDFDDPLYLCGFPAVAPTSNRGSESAPRSSRLLHARRERNRFELECGRTLGW